MGLNIFGDGLNKDAHPEGRRETRRKRSKGYHCNAFTKRFKTGKQRVKAFNTFMGYEL